MSFYFYEPFHELVSCYIILLPKEFELIKSGNFKSFPERFFRHKTINILFDLDHVKRIASDKNNYPTKTTETMVIRFLYTKDKLKPFRDKRHLSSEIVGSRIVEFNKGIVGYIELLERFRLP